MCNRDTCTYTGLKLAVSFNISSPGVTMVVAWTASNTLIRPAPCCVRVCKGSPSVLLELIGFAVVSNRVRAPEVTELDLPLTASNSAELPAMKGVAIDVPERTAKDPRGTGKVERMLPPGAATAGLKKKSFVGP